MYIGRIYPPCTLNIKPTLFYLLAEEFCGTSYVMLPSSGLSHNSMTKHEYYNTSVHTHYQINLGLDKVQTTTKKTIPAIFHTPPEPSYFFLPSLPVAFLAFFSLGFFLLSSVSYILPFFHSYIVRGKNRRSSCNRLNVASAND